MPILSRYDPQVRYRQKAQQRLSLVTGFFIIGLLCAAIGYGFGYQSARMDDNAARAALKTVQDERDKLQQTMTNLLASSHSANLRYQQIEAQLQSELPQEGPMRDIVGQIRAQLEAGIAPDRLATVIRTLSPPRTCTDPETRRFIVATTKDQQGGDNNRAVGTPAKTKDGKDESWYDPTATITLSLDWTSPEGPRTVERQGTLPLSQTAVVGNHEYRLTFSEGAKSFLKVTFDQCDYP
jgi:hypothetical protein